VSDPLFICALLARALPCAVLAASHSANVDGVLSVAVATLLLMENGLLERREGVDANGVDDVTMLEHLASTEPGPFSMMVLAGIDVGMLDSDGLLDYAREWERQQSWATARAQDALSAVLTADLPDDESKIGDELQYRAAMVATTLHWPPSSALSRLMTAERLVGELRGTYALLSDGQLSWRHASAMLEATAGLDFESVALVEARVLEAAVSQTPSELGRSARKVALAVAPLTAAENHKSAIAGRNVRLTRDVDGMAKLVATLPAADAEAVYTALDAVARQVASTEIDNSIGLPARRADVLVAWALGALADPNMPKQHGRSVQLRLTMDLPTVFGMANNPAELAHYGLIPAWAGRLLAADADWRRFVVEPVTGHLLDFGSTVYRPPQALRDFIIARDRICRFPGCSIAAERCDIDHCCPYDKGGHTASCNCHALCRRHHIAKTTGGWLLKCDGKGGVTWISPSGQQFFVPAEDHGPSR
jgi:hypothetical protein